MTMSAQHLPLTTAPLAEPLDLTSTGMPSLDSVHAVVTFKPVPGGPTFRILRTIETDTYESSPLKTAVSALVAAGQPSPTAIADALAAAAPARSDDFAGTARAAAKLSIGTGVLETVADVAALIASLPADTSMIHHTPIIDTSRTSGRVAEEQRNVELNGFLYAASREADNDFHLIIGRAPGATPEMYMTMEISGLPPSDSPAYAQIKGARDSFTAFFGAHLPQTTYDFYQPPIPVVVQGSIFFDMTHASGQRPGPPSLKSRMPTIWEVHPISSITLGALPASAGGRPAAESIQSLEPFTSPQGEHYTIIHTTETDASNQPR